MLFLDEYLLYRIFENEFEIHVKESKQKELRPDRVELTTDFIRILETFRIENFSKFRDFVEIDAISR